MSITSAEVKAIARESGFELAGVTPAIPSPHFARYQTWVERGMAGKMGYLTDRRAAVRADPRNLLPSAQSMLCLGKLYNTGRGHQPNEPIVSRYAWGRDYHEVLREAMVEVVTRLQALATFEYKICIDTAPLLERSYARAAGLGWIGKNTCLINQEQGSWFFLGELLLSIDLPPDDPPPDRCGTCTRCIDACPTAAIVTSEEPFGGYMVDSERCISYLTIELKGPIPQHLRTEIGAHVFGCDICQDVCPWNSRAPFTDDPSFQPRIAFDFPKFSYLTSDEIRRTFQESPVSRAKYTGFLRNVATVMGNLKREEYRLPLQHLSGSSDPIVQEHAIWSLKKLDSDPGDLP